MKILSAPFFNLEFFFPELIDHQGFDCVIENPPYGGFKISDEIRNELEIESKDPYGAFIARFLNSNISESSRKQGIISLVVLSHHRTCRSAYGGLLE